MKDAAKIVGMLTTPQMFLESIDSKIKNGDVAPSELYKVDFQAIHTKIKQYYTMAKETVNGGLMELKMPDVVAAVKEANSVAKGFAVFVAP